MIRRLVLLSLVFSIFALGDRADTFAQSAAMNRHGVVGIETPAEHTLFFSLLCACGCPRETLGTCTCDFAHERRSELRALLAEGKNLEQIQAVFVSRFGTKVLAVPPNEGLNILLWAAPLALVTAGIAGVMFLIRRLRRQAPTLSSAEASAPATPRDELDDRIDQEVRALEDEP